MTKPHMGVTEVVSSFGWGMSLQDRQPLNAGRMGGGCDDGRLICHFRGACHFGRASSRKDKSFRVLGLHSVSSIVTWHFVRALSKMDSLGDPVPGPAMPLSTEGELEAPKRSLDQLGKLFKRPSHVLFLI